MAGNELKITISAQDNASQVFRKIATEAERVADNLEKAGKDSGKGFDEVSRGAEKAEQSIAQLSETGSGFIRVMDGFSGQVSTTGAGLQSVGSAIDQLGQSSLNAQRQTMALQQLYGDAAAEYQQFADTIQNTTIFSDDQARQAEIYFATLKTNYGVTEEQIRRLVQVSADLATIHGMSLEDASMRVQAAIRGEGEAAEALGLTMNQQSIDRENLTLTMSNQEAAQFRLNALWEQTANVQGASSQYLETANGQWLQFQNTMQDAGQAVGDFVGPYGNMVSSLGQGLATVGEAMRGVRELQQGFSAISTFMAANPLALAAAGVTAATLAVVGWTKTLKDGESATDRFANSMHKLVESGGRITFSDVIASVKEFIGLGDEVTKVYDEADYAIWDMLDTVQLLRGAGKDAMAGRLDDFAFEAKNAQETARLYLDSQSIIADAATLAQQTGTTQEQALARIREEYTLSESEARAYATSLGVLSDALQDPTINADALIAAFDKLYWSYLNGDITYDQFTGEVRNLAANTDQFRIQVERFKVSWDDLSGSIKDGVKLASTFYDAYDEIYRAQTGSYAPDKAQRDRNQLLAQQVELQKEINAAWKAGDTDRAKELTDDLRGVNDQLAEQIRLEREALNAEGEHAAKTAAYMDQKRADRKAAWEEQKQEYEERRAAAEAEAAAEHQHNVDQADSLKQRADDRRAAWEEEKAQRQQEIEERKQFAQETIASWTSATGNDDFVSQLNLAGLGNEFTALAGDITDAGTAIDTVFRVIVGNTNAIKSQAEGVKNWAEELINVEGTLGRIDELMSSDTTVNPYGEALLSADQYKAAQDAYNSIADSTAKIGVNVDAIQAIQAPFIASFLADQSDLLESLRQQDAEQQRITLGWMDATSAAQAQQAVAMAAAAANGELGASGKAATQAMIEGLVATNPFMEDMLESIGLISVGVDEFGNKTISVNFEGAESTMATLDDLNTSLLMIADLLDNGKLDGSINIAVEQRDLEVAKQNMEALGGQTYTATVKAAVEGAKDVEDTKDDLDGFVAKDGTEVGIGVNLDDEGVDQTMRNFDELAARDGTEITVKATIEPASPTGFAPPADLPPVSLPTELEPPQGPPDLSGVPPVRVPAMLDLAGSVANDAIGDALGLVGLGPTIAVTAEVMSIDTSAIPADLRIPVSATVISVDTTAMSEMPSVDVTATVQVSGADDVDSLKSDLDGLEDKTVTLYGDATIALAAVDNVNNAPLPDRTVTLYGDATIALGAIANVNNEGLADKTAMLYGDATIALAAIANVNNTPVEDKTMTINVVTSYSTIGTPPKATEHGGLLAYANGGLIPHIAGEGSRPGGPYRPEIAHYANGGMAVLPFEGLYANPPGTYISPAPANPGAGRGALVNIEQIVIGAGADPSMARTITKEIVMRLDRALEHLDRTGGLV